MHERLGGVNYSYLMAPKGERIIVESKGDVALPMGSDVAVHFDPNQLLFFDPKTEQRLK